MAAPAAALAGLGAAQEPRAWAPLQPPSGTPQETARDEAYWRQVADRLTEGVSVSEIAARARRRGSWCTSASTTQGNHQEPDQGHSVSSDLLKGFLARAVLALASDTI